MKEKKWGAFQEYLRLKGKAGRTLTNYPNSLNSIEKVYACDLNEEFERDRCESIQEKIGKVIAEATEDVVRHTYTNSRSALRAFIGFKSGKELPEEQDEDAERPLPKSQQTDDAPPQPGTDVALNTILYGPPGTGKTYHTVIYAVSIIEKEPLEKIEQEDYAEVLKRYKTYEQDGRIAFTTFHQSYGYEEFIEGIRPQIAAEDELESEDGGAAGEVRYDIKPGIFKEFCNAARGADTQDLSEKLGIRKDAVVWKVSLEKTGDNPTRKECLENGHIRVGYDEYGETINEETVFSQGGRTVLTSFISRMQVGDIVLSCYSATTIDAVGVVTGEYEWHDEYPAHKRLRKVKWIAKNIRESIKGLTDKTMTLSTVYRFSNVLVSDVLDLVKPYLGELKKKRSDKNCVFIIDEINRGNISKIFGELITLIEPSKREDQPEAASVALAYSKEPFAVPGNVYIIGTMNTADRSIAAIDTALRRRFAFREMQPDPTVLDRVEVEGISVSAMLDKINRRIEALYDREHTIGHAYFLPLKADPSKEMLARIFENNIIPLLQEYFYEDYEKIRLVLGDNQKTKSEECFITSKSVDYGQLFGDEQLDFDAASRYELNREALDKIEAYRYF